MFSDLGHLFLNGACLHCGNRHALDYLCLSCRCLSGLTDHFGNPDNLLVRRMFLRGSFQHAASLFLYTKNGPVQSLLKAIKYGHHYKAGIHFGKVFGHRYLASKLYAPADLIIPMPLHFSRKKKRGYNQCEMIARGISLVTGIPIARNILRKHTSHESQTRQGRSSRTRQVADSFCLHRPEQIYKKSILLIDDVLTTGATAEAAAMVLERGGCGKIQLGLLATAIN